MQPEGRSAHVMDKQIMARKKSGIEWLAICLNAVQAAVPAVFMVEEVIYGNASPDIYLIGFFVVPLFNLFFFSIGPLKKRRSGMALAIVAAILNFAQYSLAILLAVEFQAVTDLVNVFFEVFHHSTSADGEIAVVLIAALIMSAVNFLALRKWWKALPVPTATETPRS